MKLVMTLLVRNEVDILEDNLDYHLAQGVDFVIVTDHGSSDGTSELLRAYERQGAVRVLREEGYEHHQSRRVTRMAQLALTEHAADWVIHNDADEFWWPLSGSLRDVFDSIPDEYGQIEVTRRFNFLPSRDTAGPFYSRLIHREVRSFGLGGAPLEPKTAHRPHPEVTVAPGNHWISGGDLRPSPIADMLQIFHFPMRSYQQFERKVVQIGNGYESLDFRSPGVGRDQLKLLQVYREDGLRRYYEDALIEDAALERGLSDGTIVVDRRLQSFMRDLRGGVDPASRTDGPATRALVTAALNARVELDRERDQLQREVGSARDQLAAAEELLRQVRASRLMRWTAPLRRWWYRLSNRNAT